MSFLSHKPWPHVLVNPAHAGSAPVHAPFPRFSGARRVTRTWAFIAHLLRLLDLVALSTSAWIARHLVFGMLPFDKALSAISYFFILCGFAFLQLTGSYGRRRLQDSDRLVRATAQAGAAILAAVTPLAIFLADDGASLRWLSLTLALSALQILFNRIAICAFIRHSLAQGHLCETVVLVGATPAAQDLLALIAANPSPYLHVAGIFDDRLARIRRNFGPWQVLGTVGDLLGYARNHQIDRVLVTIPWTAEQRISQLLHRLRTIPVRVQLCPTKLTWESRGPRGSGGLRLVTLSNNGLGEHGYLLKWAEDKLAALFILAAISPLLVVVALLVKLDSRGPVIFKQPRHGFNNEIFNVLKFRTMRVEAAADAKATPARKNDPRITRIGAFLRRTSLDELPQFINVLLGQMSIVGPRPHPVHHNLRYAEAIDEYYARHNFKPGITGWAQVNDLRGEVDTDDKMRERVRHDLYYIDNWSLWMDVKIILLTVYKVWLHKNAY